MPRMQTMTGNLHPYARDVEGSRSGLEPRQSGTIAWKMAAPSSKAVHSIWRTGDPELIAGGGDVVLKPSDDDVKVQWVSELLISFWSRASKLFCLSQLLSVVSGPGTVVTKGWTASSFLNGVPQPNKRFAHTPYVCRVFNTDMTPLQVNKLEFIEHRSDRSSEPDRVTRSEKVLNDVAEINSDVLDSLRQNLTASKGCDKALGEQAQQSTEPRRPGRYCLV
ncbi:hypothetical protein BJ170DRAFT_104596 [Xylariales sp. AK1849]|nr:hypothetical protein BJ170DRAFT_104596 [Xylariales sp. AK1849]